MGRWLKTGLVLAVGINGWGAPRAWAQVLERDVTVTGPRGRSIQRDTRIERGPGFVDRQMNIQRPGGTFHGNTLIQRPPGIVGGGRGGFVPGPPWRGGPFPRPFIGREVIVNNPGIGPGAAILGGAGLFGLGMLTGSALSAPKPAPPVYYGPPVVVGAPVAAPNVVYNPPQPYAPAPPPATVVVDPVAQALTRLQSNHDHSRRDGASTLGRLRDPRAVPALVDHLKNDKAKEVRVAAASALGEIGDPRAVVFLERATIYDKKQEVRDAAAQALSRIPTQTTAAPSETQSTTPRTVTVPALEPSAERVPPPPRPEP